jgi:hypothetical protein
MWFGDEGNVTLWCPITFGMLNILLGPDHNLP